MTTSRRPHLTVISLRGYADPTPTVAAVPAGARVTVSGTSWSVEQSGDGWSIGRDGRELTRIPSHGSIW